MPQFLPIFEAGKKSYCKAPEEAEAKICFTILKDKFYSKFPGRSNEQQQKAIQRMFTAAHKGFKGSMNKTFNTSGATAMRELQLLAQMGAFVQVGSGRSTRYELGLG